MSDPNKIGVVEIFGPTIMGEGILTGTPTMFIRTGSCDYNEVCLKCDSMHAVDPKQYKDTIKAMTSEEIVDEVMSKAKGCHWVTLSGGNPVVWNLTEVIIKLQTARKMRVCLETQGTRWADWITYCDLVYVAPKGPGMVKDADLSFINFVGFMNRLEIAFRDNAHRIMPKVAIKVPVFNDGDLDFAEKVTKRYPQYPLCLSVGNHYPPGDDDITLNHLRGSVLEAYEYVIKGVMERPTLMNATILPQMHVLVYGNKQGV